MPANPACWETLLVGEQGDEYRALRASVALWPLQASDCVAGLDVEPTASVRALERSQRGGVRWINEYRAPLTFLRARAHDDCRFRALLQFARLPYYSLRAPHVAGDLRYDRQAGLDFSDVPLLGEPETDRACPRFLPSWVPPRAELLR
jgi:hypothetical protein